MALAKPAAAAAAEVKRALSSRVVAMYRRMCRQAPRVVVLYSLEQTAAEVRHMLLLQFRKNAHVTDPRIVDMLLARGVMEEEETLNQWKQRSHVIGLLQPELEAPDVWYDEEEFARR